MAPKPPHGSTKPARPPTTRPGSHRPLSRPTRPKQITQSSPPLTTARRNINMYKYKQTAKKPLTNQELHARANKARRQEAKEAKIRYALSKYDAQVEQGVENPQVPTIAPSPARQRRAAIRATMRDALENGDLTHIPLLVDFLKKIHSPTRTNKYEHDQLHQDPNHVAMIKDEVAALQSFGLFAKTPVQGQGGGMQGHNVFKQRSEARMDEAMFGDDVSGLALYKQGKHSIDADAPGDYQLDEMELKLQALQDDADSLTNMVSPRHIAGQSSGDHGLDEDEAYGSGDGIQADGNVAQRLQKDPHALLKSKGNDLSHLLLEPVYGMLEGDAHGSTTTLNHLHAQTIKQSKAPVASPIAGFAQIKGPKQFATLQPMSHSITGNVISSISLHSGEFGSLPGSPSFRINPQNLKKSQIASPKTKGTQFGEEIDDDDDIEMEREADAQLAMDNQGTLGLNDSPLQKHASEFTTNSLIPTLGFLREYHAQNGEKQKREMAEVEDVDGLGSVVGGIGSLSRTDGHYTNPRQQAVISGRRSRAIETIARTSAAVLAKRQLLAHNRSILSSISPTLAQGSREQRDKHYVDLYALGYQITGIHLTKDLSTCVINWSAPCLFPLPESKNTMELERPLLDVVNETMHGEAARSGRVELNPQNDAMRVLANAQTHKHRRASYEPGAHLTHRHVFTGAGHNLFQEKQFEQMRAEELRTGRKTEIFLDESGVVIKKDPSGELKITSQGDPKLWKLRPIFQRGSYVPGTMDMLPPYLRKNSQVMTPQQQLDKQREAEQRIRMEELNIRAGLHGQTDPRFTGEADALLREEEGTGGFGMEELGLGPNVPTTVAKQTLDAMVNATHDHSPVSRIAHKRALKLVAGATEYYLNSMVPSIRWALGQSLNTKYVPQLKFEFDVQYGATKQRAKTINAVLQRQYKRQIERVEFGLGAGAEDIDFKPLDEDQKPIPIHTIGSAEERATKMELALEKEKLLKRGKFEEVEIIDQYVKQERTETARSAIRTFENSGFQDYDEVAPHDEAVMRRLQVKDDNVAKLLATADALKTGVENDLALSTRLKYHDITKADRIKLVSMYLDLPEQQVRGLSEDRIDVAISMLRRDMATEERRKQRQAFKDEKVAEGLSKAQLEREMVKYDTKMRKLKKKDKAGLNNDDDNDGVARWQANVDSDQERPEMALLMGDDDGEVAEMNGDGNGSRSGSGSGQKNQKSGQNGPRGQIISSTASPDADGLVWGSQDSSIAAAFMTNTGKDTSLVKGGKKKPKLEVDQDDLVKFRQQYLYGENENENDENSQNGHKNSKKQVSYLEFDSDDSDSEGSQPQSRQPQQHHQQQRQQTKQSSFLQFDEDDSDDDLPQSKSRLALAQKQQQNQQQNQNQQHSAKPKQYLQFEDDSSSEDRGPTPAQRRRGEAQLSHMMNGTGEAKM